MRWALAVLCCSFLGLIVACGGGGSTPPAVPKESQEQPEAQKNQEVDQQVGDDQQLKPAPRPGVKWETELSEQSTIEIAQAIADADQLFFRLEQAWASMDPQSSAWNRFAVAWNKDWESLLNRKVGNGISDSLADYKLAIGALSNMYSGLEDGEAETYDKWKGVYLRDITAAKNNLRPWQEKHFANSTPSPPAPSNPEMPKRPSLSTEEKATSKFSLAMQFIEKGNKTTGKKWLQDVIDEYPETEAAAEARKLLDELQ